MPEGSIRVTVLWSSGPRVTTEKAVVVAKGSTVRVALEASDTAVELTGALPGGLDKAEVGIWSRRVTLDEVLADGDRVELYRGLLVDPKVARRERFQKQGSKGAGLFAKKRAGAKAGY